MADQFIQVPPQSTGLKIDVTELTVGANTVERERQNIADPTDAAGLAKVENAAPGASDYGLVVRNIPSGTQAVSGTVTAAQATGSNLHVVVDTAPTTTVTGTVGATQSTSPWVDNLTQVAGASLGATAVVNYGSSPAAVAVPAVNAFVTNTVPVTGAFFQGTQPVSGTVTSNQGTANTKANAWPTELTDGTNGPAAVKAASTAAIATDAALVVAVSPNNSVAVTGTFFQGTQPVSGTVTANQGTANTAANSWQVEVTDGTNVLGVSAHPLRVDPTGTTTQPVSGTVTVGNASLAVTQSTSPWVVGQSTGSNLHAVLDTGSTTAVTQATGTNLHAVLDSGSTTAVTQATAANLNATVVQATGTNLHTNVDNFPATQAVSGTVAVTQSTSPWVVQDGLVETNTTSISSTLVFQNQMIDLLTQVLAQLKYNNILLGSSTSGVGDDPDTVAETLIQ